MTMIQMQTQVPLETLLQSLRQLNNGELEQIVERAALLRAQRRAPSLSQAESDLLLKINQGVVPAEVKERCTFLTQKSRQGNITTEEQAELMSLVDEIELLNAERMNYLIQLAQLRRTSLDDLLQTLEITPLHYE